MPSLKQIGTICFLTIFFISPIFADDEPTLIPTPASCNNSVLNTTEGSAALEAIYTPNTIGTTWYSDGVQLEVDNSATSCTYDTAMTLPTNPTKPGYEFNGWKIKRCEIPSTDVNNNGNARASKRLSNGDVFAYGGATVATYGLEQPGEWGVSWPNGDKVTGEAFCSITDDGKIQGQTGNPGTTGGAWCWCKATHYTANNAQQCSLSSPAWVFLAGYGSADACASYCADLCGRGVQDDSDFRAGLFGSNVAQ